MSEYNKVVQEVMDMVEEYYLDQGYTPAVEFFRTQRGEWIAIGGDVRNGRLTWFCPVDPEQIWVWEGE